MKLNTISHPETKVNQENIKFQITKEYMEQWMVQALDAEPMGAGSYPVDIKTKDFLADIKSMSIKINKDKQFSSQSGETSLGQKFQEPNLDSFFTQGEYEKVKNLWIKILKKKYKSVVRDTGIKKIYYFFLMRAECSYYLFATKLNYKKISQNNIGVYEDRSTKDSVFLQHFIDNDLGNVKIYKAKKRLELRLNPKSFIDNDYFIEFPILEYPEKINLRNVDLEQHLNTKITKFFCL